MSGALRKTMVYLGLAEDDEHYEDELYEEYDDETSQRPEVPRSERSQVTPLPTRSLARVVPGSGHGDLHRITTIHPRTYNEAKTIGESFREGVPVIMNLSDMGDSDAKRLVDFAAGLVFGLHGSIERVTNKVFLLSPAHIEVTAEDKEPTNTAGLFNQS
ncbi:cell division protein SepF [Angustibacter luteus]|uniref:Cell division protein SepF n=1 Tax=Angustibacter luteus TaxID=658456 RepID=A0ABW1J9X9_9ACTN